MATQEVFCKQTSNTHKRTAKYSLQTTQGVSNHCFLPLIHGDISKTIIKLGSGKGTRYHHSQGNIGTPVCFCLTFFSANRLLTNASSSWKYRRKKQQRQQIVRVHPWCRRTAFCQFGKVKSRERQEIWSIIIYIYRTSLYHHFTVFWPSLCGKLCAGKKSRIRLFSLTSIYTSWCSIQGHENTSIFFMKLWSYEGLLMPKIPLFVCKHPPRFLYRSASQHCRDRWADKESLISSGALPHRANPSNQSRLWSQGRALVRSCWRDGDTMMNSKAGWEESCNHKKLEIRFQCCLVCVCALDQHVMLMMFFGCFWQSCFVAFH